MVTLFVLLSMTASVGVPRPAAAGRSHVCVVVREFDLSAKPNGKGRRFAVQTGETVRWSKAKRGMAKARVGNTSGFVKERILKKRCARPSTGSGSAETRDQEVASPALVEDPPASPPEEKDTEPASNGRGAPMETSSHESNMMKESPPRPPDTPLPRRPEPLDGADADLDEAPTAPPDEPALGKTSDGLGWTVWTAAGVLGVSAGGLFYYADRVYYPNELAPVRDTCLRNSVACDGVVRDAAEYNGQVYRRMMYATYGLAVLTAGAIAWGLISWMGSSSDEENPADPSNQVDVSRVGVMLVPEGGFVTMGCSF